MNTDMQDRLNKLEQENNSLRHELILANRDKIVEGTRVRELEKMLPLLQQGDVEQIKEGYQQLITTLKEEIEVWHQSSRNLYSKKIDQRVKEAVKEQVINDLVQAGLKLLNKFTQKEL